MGKRGSIGYRGASASVTSRRGRQVWERNERDADQPSPTMVGARSLATLAVLALACAVLVLLDGAKASAARQLQIFNGSEVTTEAYPFVASLVDSKLKHLCTGSLVSPGVILTAAHCFSRHDRVYGYDNKGGAKEERDFHESYRVILGRNVAGSGNVSDAIEVEKIVIGEPFEFAMGSAWWDVALVFLDKCVADYAPIKIRSGGSQPLPIGTSARVVGYGDTERNCIYTLSGDLDEPGDALSEMDYAVVRCEEDIFCADHGLFCKHTLCLRSRRRATCDRDSGGPVFTRSDAIGVTGEGQWVQIGVLSGGQLSWETNALASLRQRSRDQITFEDHARAVDLANYTAWLKHWLATDSCLKDGRVEEIFV